MTPAARQELRRYCEDALKVRKAKEPWTFADFSDAAVAVVCVLGLYGFIVWEARGTYEANKRAEPKVRLVQEIKPRKPLIGCEPADRIEYNRVCSARKRSSLTGIRQ